MQQDKLTNYAVHWQITIMMDKIRGGESLTGRVFCVYAKVEVSAHTHTHNKHTVKTQLLSLNTKSVADDVENLWIIHQTRF